MFTAFCAPNELLNVNQIIRIMQFTLQQHVSTANHCLRYFWAFTVLKRFDY